MFDLYLITPPGAPAAHIERVVQSALEGATVGRVAVQLRAGHLPRPALGRLARRLREHTRRLGCPLLVSGDVALAAEVETDGVQLPERGPSIEEARRVLGDEALVGASRHDLLGVQQASAAGADFATLSPVFEVAGKGHPLAVAGFEAVARQTRLPLFALGGVSQDSAADLLHAGAAGLSVIREVMGAADPAAAVRGLIAALDLARQAR